MVLVFERTGSPLLASLTFALGFLPYLVSGALLSAVVDRMPLRRLLVGCDLVCAGLVGVMAAPDRLGGGVHPSPLALPDRGAERADRR